MNNIMIKEIKTKISDFNCAFNNTAADSNAFSKVLNSGMLSSMIYSYIVHKNSTNESQKDFTYRLAHFSIECINQIYKPYGRIVRDEDVFNEYFTDLFNSLPVDLNSYS